MKHLRIPNKVFIITAIVAALMFIGTVSLFAETKREGNTFSTEQTVDVMTKYTWKDKDGTIYPIYITKNGACYVKRISKKTGKEYKHYLPKDVQATIKKELNI
jgi:hypothetical protein